MEEGRAEQRLPPNSSRALRHPMQSPWTSCLVEIEHGGPDDRGGGRSSDPRDLGLQAFRERDIVRVEPRDVPPRRPVEGAVERGGEPELLVVRDHGETRIRDRREHGGRPVRGGVVDHDQLEVPERLPEHALDGEAHPACVVVHGQQNGNERHGR